MYTQELLKQLNELVREYLSLNGLVLVELSLRYEGRNIVLKVAADRPEGGITVEECARVNNDLGSILQAKEIIRQSYIIEVCSPGVDRPLKTKDDFLRCLKRRARFFLNEAVFSRLELEGTINAVKEDSVYIEIEEGKEIAIPLSKINKAKQIVE